MTDPSITGETAPEPKPGSVLQGGSPRLAETILRYRFTLLVFLGLLTLAGTFGMSRLRADFSFEALFLTNDEEAVFFESFRDRFEESNRDTIVLLQGEGLLLEREGMRFLQDLTGAVEALEGH